MLAMVGAQADEIKTGIAACRTVSAGRRKGGPRRGVQRDGGKRVGFHLSECKVW